MEKNIKDYLHYYLGCEVVGTGKKPGTKHYTLVGVTMDGGCLFRTIPEGFSIDLGFDWKPILRPLSDMTEEEILDTLILHFHETSRDVVTQTIKSVKRKQEVKMASKYGTGIPYVSYNDSGIPHSDGVLSFSELNADQFHYLLSKGFDLFGLIENGLAIHVPVKVEEGE